MIARRSRLVGSSVLDEFERLRPACVFTEDQSRFVAGRGAAEVPIGDSEFL